MKIRFLEIPDGARVAYAVHGRGPFLVCPAWWVSNVGEDWEHPPFRRFFERLAGHHTVVRYDRPGVGMSDRDRIAESLDDEVAVLRAVYKALGIDSATLLAVSCGGPPALRLAAEELGKVERLIFYGSYADGAAICEPAIQEAMCSLVEAHWGLGSEALAGIFHPGLSGRELRALGRRQRSAAGAATAARLLRLTYAMSAADSMGRVQCPTLVVHRKVDRAIPVGAGRALASGIRGASFVTLDGAIHPPWEGESGVLEVIDAFLRGQELPDPHPGTAATGATNYLDRANRELVVGGGRRALSPLEYGLLVYLEERADCVVTRDDALRDVWNQPYGGSNVVDVVVASLRRKLGPCHQAIETVKGHGYRYRSGVLAP